MSEPIAFERPRKSLPHVFNNSPPGNFNSGKLVKEPSTSTLVPGEGSLENTPPSAAEKESEQKPNASDNIKSTPGPDDTDISSIENSPTKPLEMSILQRRLRSKLRPSRTISLHLDEKKEIDSRSLTGVQKFRKSHRGFFRTFSQPVSPTEAEPPVGFPPSRASFFRRKHSKGNDFASTKASSRASLFSRRHSRDIELPNVPKSAQGILSRRSSKESETSSAAASSPGGLLSRRHSREVESPSATTSQGDPLSRRSSKDIDSPVTSSGGNLFNRHLSKDIESPRGSTSSLKNLFSRRMSKDGKVLSPLQIQANPQIIISPNFVEEKNQKNKEISEV